MLVDNTNQNNTLVRNPDFSDMLIQISNNYGPFENMSTLIVNSTDVGKKPYAYGHYAIEANPQGDMFQVKFFW